MKVWKYFLVAFLVIAVDQAIKLLVHFNMDQGPMGEIHLLGDVFKLHYTLNEGMAFGITLGFKYGKLLLTLFRIGAGGLIAYYIVHLHKNGGHKGLIICAAMVLGGALGNVLDSVFYGVFLEHNLPLGAPMVWFHGQVIDMFYLDIYEGYMPNWLPIYGGKWMSLWPIFNVADAAIFLAVTIVLIKQKVFYPQPENENSVPNDPSENVAS